MSKLRTVIFTQCPGQITLLEGAEIHQQGQFFPHASASPKTIFLLFRLQFAGAVVITVAFSSFFVFLFF